MTDAVPGRGSAAAPLSLMAVAMVSVQIGAALAKQLFATVGAEGVTALRVVLAALMLVAAVRPWRAAPQPIAWPALAAFGVSLGVMNLLFYSSLQRLPLGIAVGLEFTGPLAVAMISSRRWTDFLWIALAALGVLVLLPLGHPQHGLDPVGIAFALGAGVCWALYILLGPKAGGAGGARAVALAMVIAAVVVLPFGLLHSGGRLLSWPVLLTGCGVALLSSVIPYSLEMFAMKRIPTRVFGTLMSVEPAIGALMGFLLLHERLTLRQDLAIAAIILASLGTTLTMRAGAPAPPA